MPSFEVGFKTEFGKVSLHFQDLSELQALLAQLPEIINRVQGTVKTYASQTIPPVEPGLEHVYMNLPGNLTKLLTPIGEGPDTVTFIVYTKYPIRMSVDQIADSAGISVSVVSSYLTKERYRDRYIGDSQSGYSLSFVGLKYVNETIKPELLRKATKEEKQTA